MTNPPALAETASLDALFEALGSPSARIRYGAAKLLRLSSEHEPELLYPRFDSLVRLLHGDNTILRWNATLILGNLAAADSEGKFDRVLDQYFAPITGHELIGAANVLRSAAGIALAKPGFARRIAEEILKVRRAHYATPECRNVAIGHAVQALDRFFPLIPNQRPVIAFVRKQVDNPRPATRRKAAKFLQRWARGRE